MSKPNTKNIFPYPTKLTILVAAAFIVQVMSINLFPLDYDEGVHYLIAYFINQGYQPYGEIFVSRGPLFAVILQSAWILTAGNLFLMKTFFALLNLPLLVAIGYLSKEFLDERASLLGVFLLSATLPYLSASSALMADLLSVTLATMSIALTWIYLQKGSWAWLFLAGVLFFMGLAVKLLVLIMGLLIVLLLAIQYWPLFRWSGLTVPVQPVKLKLIKELVLLAGAGITVLVIFSVFFDLRLVYHSVIDIRMALREAGVYSLEDNFQVLLQFLVDNSALSVGMLMAFYFLRTQPEHSGWFAAIWWLIAVIWLMIQSPLRSQHNAVLWPSMALLSGWGFIQLAKYVNKLSNFISFPTQFGRGVSVIVAIIAFVSVVFNIYLTPAFIIRANDIEDQEDWVQLNAKSHAVAFLQTITEATDCVISDDAVLNIRANRFPTPALAEISYARIQSNRIDQSLIEAEIEENNCKALVVSSRLKEMQDLKDWAEEYFTNYINFEGINIYYAP